MKPKALCAAILPTLAIGAYCLWPASDPSKETVAAPAAQIQPATAAPAVQPVGVPPQVAELSMALEQKSIEATFVGNGRERLTVSVTNKSNVPLQVTVPVGQMFEGERCTLVVVRQGEAEVAPGQRAEFPVQTAATRSSNKIADVPCELSYTTLPRLEALLTFVQAHPELSVSTIQTAVLAVTENLPLSSVAKFALASNPLPSRFNTDAFRADTFDIVTALTILRTVGVKEETLAMTVDPQLRIESMIDPSSRPIAMRYYAIDPEREWDFWRAELLNGEPCTRHYALYGIARFYPEVALQMLPRWARETRTNPIYRLAAVQALADTQRPEAVEILRGLVEELGKTTELAKAAKGAADYLDYRLARIGEAKSVAFRASQGGSQHDVSGL